MYFSIGNEYGRLVVRRGNDVGDYCIHVHLNVNVTSTSLGVVDKPEISKGVFVFVPSLLPGAQAWVYHMCRE